MRSLLGVISCCVILLFAAAWVSEDTKDTNVRNVLQNRRSVVSLPWHEWFSCKCKEWKVYCYGLEMKISRRHLADYAKNCTKKRGARAARLFFLIQPIKSFSCVVVVAVAVVIFFNSLLSAFEILWQLIISLGGSVRGKWNRSPFIHGMYQCQEPISWSMQLPYLT